MVGDIVHDTRNTGLGNAFHEASIKRTPVGDAREHAHKNRFEQSFGDRRSANARLFENLQNGR